MSEPLLFSLPSELVGSIVLSKLSLRDIVQLDSAVLARKSRVGSLACWYRRTCPIHVHTQALGLDYTVLKWLLQRSLCPEILYICNANMNVLTLIRENASLVKSKINIRIGCCNTDWESFIGQAQSSVVLDKITELEIFVVHPHAEVGMPPALCVPLCQLRSLLWHSDGVPNSALTAVVGNAAGLTALMVDCQLPLPADFSAALCARQDTLTALDLRVNVLTDSALTEIAISCRRLTSFHLYIPWHSGTDGWVTDAGVHSVVTICERLESIYIYSSALTAASVTSIFAHGRSLTRVHVDFTGLSDAALRRRPPSPTVTDAGLCAVIKGCRRLESFTSSFDSSHSESLTCAFAHGVHLSSIDMITTLGDEALEARPFPSTPLRELRCRWGVMSVDTLNKHAHVLSSLTDLTIATIVDGRADTLCAALRMMPLLRVLNIKISFPFGAELPTAVLDAIAQGCTLLTKLTVEHKLEDDAERAVIAIARKNPGLVRFKAVTSSRGVGFTDAMLLALAQYCPELQKVELCYCKRITDDAVIALARSCHKLTRLELPGSVLLTDAAVYAPAEFRPHLQGLNVDSCTLITEATIEHLLRSCRKLGFLYISEVVLPEESISRLCEDYWVAINVWSPTSEHRW